MKKDVIVLGIGNLLMSDEGIGNRLVEHFLENCDRYPAVEFVDAGTAGMSLLHLLDGRRKAIIIDCAFMDTEPGTIRRFKPDDVQSVKKLAHQSLHEADLLKIIDLAKQLGQCPESVVIFGIEPEKVEPGQQLSKRLSAKVNDYLRLIGKELAL